MKRYQGDVCFVDTLGIDALTRKKIPLADFDYAPRSVTFDPSTGRRERFSERDRLKIILRTLTATAASAIL